MIAFSYYLLKVLICSTVLFGYYWLALRNKVFHGYNRFYLLAIIVLSLTLPTLHINLQQQADAPATNTIKILQVVTATDDFVDDLNLKPEVQQITFNDVVPYIYMLVSVCFLLAFITMLIRIYVLYKKHHAIQLQNIYLVNTDAAKGTPFSFFRTIFWNNEIEIQSTTGQSIFKHELAHIQERHSYDKIFMTLVLTIFWCNPIFWLIKKELNMIHEFIADKYAVEDGDTAEFASMLLAVAYPKHNFSITNHFFYSPIKRRLAMITKNKNPKVNYISRLLALPILLVVFAAFTLKAKTIKNKIVNSSATTINNNEPETATSKEDKGLLASIVDIINGTTENKKVETKKSAFTAERPLIVVIDAGHGGQDGGALNKNGIAEKDMTLALIKKIKAMHKNETVKIILSREEDVYNSPTEKAAFAAAQNADLFISVHMDAISSKNKVKESGMCVYVAKDEIENSAKSKVLASSVIGSFTKNYAIPVTSNPRQRTVGIKVLQANNIPSIIIEAGYIDNDKDLSYLQSDKGQEAFATNVLAAIDDYAANNFVSAKAQVMAVDSPPTVAVTLKKVTHNSDEGVVKTTGVTMSFDSFDKNENNGLFIINNVPYELDQLRNKTIKAKSATSYKTATEEQIKKYGAKAKNGIMIFENATIENDFTEKLKQAVKFNVDEVYFVDASQRKRSIIEASNEINKRPTYIIDGIVMDEIVMKSMDPNDIQSVNVLKDKAALDAYGDKGKYGVIEVKTKADTHKFDTRILEECDIPKFQIGSLTKARLSVADFKSQKEIIITKGYTLASCTVYLSGEGFPETETTELVGGDLSKIKSLLDKCIKGSSITFVNIKANGPNGIRRMDERSFILY
jgi:N-acetylmuramoyl-L-alanine amidase